MKITGLSIELNLKSSKNTLGDFLYLPTNKHLDIEEEFEEFFLNVISPQVLDFLKSKDIEFKSQNIAISSSLDLY